MTEPFAERVSAATLAVAAHRFHRGVEVALVERADLGFVREQHVDLVLDESQPLGPVAVDAERVGERERHLVARRRARCAAALRYASLASGRSQR